MHSNTVTVIHTIDAKEVLRPELPQMPQTGVRLTVVKHQLRVGKREAGFLRDKREIPTHHINQLMIASQALQIPPSWLLPSER
jgi:hypothetical protein